MKRFLPCCFLFLVALFFFNKTLLKGLVPFPGDLLVAEYQPWRSQSFLGYIAGSFPQKAQYFDVLRQLFPWKTLTIDTYRSGQFPLWNPYNFSGAPLLANNQSAVFYPLNFLFGIFSQIQAWTLLVMLQPILASLFMYLYCRRLSLSPGSSFLSALAYGYSLYMSVFLEYNTLGHVMLWLPLALWAIESGKLGIFGVSIVAAGFAGHLQLFAIMLVFILFYIFFRIKNIVFLSCFLAILLLSLGVGAIQHFPTWELLGNSARISHPYQNLIDTLLVRPQQLLKFISPDIFGNPATRNYLLADSYPSKALYIGLIPFILAIFALLTRQKNELVRIYSGTTALLLLMLIRNPVSELIYRFPIPFLSTSSPTNAIFLVSFALSILAGFGFDQARRGKKAGYMPIVVIAALLLLAWGLATTGFLPIQKNNLIYTTLLFFVSICSFVLFWKRERLLFGILILVTVFDLFYFFQKFNPFVPAALVFPATSVTGWLAENGGIDRFWGYGTAVVPANVATHYRIFSPDGYDPLYPKRYGELIGAGRNGKLARQFTNETRSDAAVVPGFGESDLPSNPFRLKLLQLLGVRYILDRSENGSTEKTFPPGIFSNRETLDGWRILEYKEALPRAYLAAKTEIFSTPEEFETRFFDPSFDPKKTILLEEPVDLPQTDGVHNDTLSLLRYGVSEVVFETKTTSSKILFLSDTHFPGWAATVDTTPTKIYRAFWSFRAVVVPPGNHTVSFFYRPYSFLLGKKVTMISLLFFMLAVLILPKIAKRYA